MRTIIVLLLTMFLTTGIFGQTMSGGVIIVNEKGILVLEGCPPENNLTGDLLTLVDEFGTQIPTKSVEENVLEVNTSDLDNSQTITLISGDCIITRKIK